jgi:hypothetical protein
VSSPQCDEDDRLTVLRDHRDEPRVEIRGHRLDRLVLGQGLEHGLDLVVVVGVEGGELLAREDRDHVGGRNAEALVEPFLRDRGLAVEGDQATGLQSGFTPAP